jgi:hypothetical protein
MAARNGVCMEPKRNVKGRIKQLAQSDEYLEQRLFHPAFVSKASFA